MKPKTNQVSVYTLRKTAVRAFNYVAKKRWTRARIRSCARAIGCTSAAVVDCLNAMGVRNYGGK